MKRAKKMLAFVLAAAMLMSNIAYAAPEGGTDTGVAVDTLSLDPTEEAGGETPTEEVPEETVPDETPEEQVSEETETTGGETETTGGETETPDPADGTEVTAPTEEGGEEETTSEESKNVEETTPAEETAEDTTPAEEPSQTPAEEVQETPEESTDNTAVAYDITFQSKEQHGKVLTMDDQEVKEGETLQTDENGMARFKVKANDGYEVAKVVNKADNTPLTLVENSYYEIQVADNTVIEIYYNKVPAADDSEEADDNGDDVKAEDESGKAEAEESDEDVKAEENGEADVSMSVARLLAEPRASVHVTVNKEGQEPGTSTISTGYISETKPTYVGFTFDNATVDGNEIVYIGVYESSTGESLTYYSIDGKSAELLGDKTIELNYSLTPSTVTYQYEPSMGTVTGPSTAKAGEQVTFIAEPTLGNEIVSVMVGTTPLEIADGQTEFSFTMGNADEIVNVRFREATSFNVTYVPLSRTEDYVKDLNFPAVVNNGQTLTATFVVDDWLTSTTRTFRHIVVNGHMIELDEGNGSGYFDGGRLKK